jgi:plastocyanin
MTPPEELMKLALKLVVAVSVVTTLSACAKTDDAARDTAAADTASLAPETPSPSTAAPAVGTTTGEPDLVHIRLAEWTVRVGKSPIRAGRTTFHAMNEGKYQHAFEIEGNGEEWKVDAIKPGGTATLAATLTPGTYTVYCPLVDTHGNHQKRGMSTTLVVQ